MNTKFFKYNNLQIEFISQGEGRDILFLHGGSVSFRSSTKFIKELSKYFKVWAISLPGAGNSSKLPKNWENENYSDLINDFCTMNKINPILAGHSFGGAISLQTSLKFPEKFKELILISPAGIKQKNPRKSVFRVFKDHFKLFFSNKSIYKDDLLLNLKKHFFDMSKISKNFKELLLDNQLTEIDAKVLIFGARDDKILDSFSWVKLKNKIQRSKLFQMEGGHAFHEKKFEEIVNIIKNEFLR